MTLINSQNFKTYMGIDYIKYLYLLNTGNYI